MLVVLAIMAILSAIAAPSFKNLIQSSTISSNVNTFLADMRYARSESIKRGGGVVMCRSGAPEADNPECSSTGDWVDGWIIFHDWNDNGTQENDEALLRVQSPITSVDAITASVYKFDFTATGRIPFQNGTLTFGGDDYATDVKRCVVISTSGRARIADTCS